MRASIKALLLAQSVLAIAAPSRHRPSGHHRVEANTAYGPDGEVMLALQAQARTNLEADLDSFAAQGASNGCTKENMTIRKEWRFMTPEERVAYTNAVTCLTTKPSPYGDNETMSGVTNLFDAFAAIHLILTPYVHADAIFLSWHRYYLYVYEQALKNECGYTGVSPYWEWGLDTDDLTASPLFNGDPYSLGSNGYPVANRTATFDLGQALPFRTPDGVSLPAGTGGGCVHSGPFSNLTIHIGPYGLASVPYAENPLAYNPRCLQRDLDPYALQGWAAFNWTTWTITNASDIENFQGKLAGGLPTGNEVFNGWGPHGGGHMAVGGEWGSMTDLYASPQDPSFFVHHGQVDRVWTIWQNLDIENRRNALSGTTTYANIPPSDNATLDTLLDMGPLAPQIRVRDVMSTVGVNGSGLWGPGLCYYYE